MPVSTLINAAAATGAGTGYQFADEIRVRSPNAIVQAIITGTGTVALEGSLNGSTWFPVTTFSASGAQVIDLPPRVRGNVTAFTSGTVTLLLDFVPR